MANVYQDLCSVGNLTDIYAGKCVFSPQLTKGFFVTQNPNFKIDLSDLTLATFKDYLKDRDLYLLKGFNGAEGEVTGIQVGATGYGNNKIVSRGGNANIVFDYPFTLCTFRQLQEWHDLTVYVFPIDEAGRVGGRITSDDTGDYLRPIKSTFGVLEYLPFKFAETDVVVNPLTWLADKIKLNHFQEFDFDIDDVDGVIPVEIEVTDNTATVVTISVTAGCNGTGVTGLALLLENLDSGSLAAGTIAEVGNGVYTISGLTTATDYSVNLSSSVVEDDLGTLYGALDTPLAYTTA